VAEPRGRALRRRVDAAVARADGLTGAPTVPDPFAAASPASRLAAATDRCLAALRAPRGVPPGDAAALGATVADLQDLVALLHDDEHVERRLRIAGCELGLARLRVVPTAAALLDRVCDEVAASCGFARVLLSRVDDDTWSPWMVNEAVRDAAWWIAWDGREVAVTEVPFEAALVAEHRPGLVTDTAGADSHRFFHEGRSASYVAAPIATAGRVVGFLHADHADPARRCDAVDRDVLWAFAEGFAHLYERTALLEGMRQQRQEVREILDVVDEAMAAMTETELELAVVGDADDRATPRAPVVDGSRGRLDDLTPREREVLELIVSGARNGDIAEQLVISPATVKTHVRHVLAKLGVANRTQAIAVFVRGDDGP
jgi:DNA-binding CsgD family transcriptional regulator